MNLVKDVVGAVYIKDGKLFAARRGESKYPYVAHKCEFVGGKREDGESCEAALRREIKEETGAEIKIVRPFMTYRYDYPDFSIYLHTYIVDFLTEPAMLEHEAFFYVSFDEIDPDDWAPADRKALCALALAYGDKTEKTVTSKEIFHGKVVRLFEDTVLLPDGKTASREVIRHIGASAVLVVDDRNNVCFCRQYRYALGRETLEIPAGKRDSFDEDYLDAAKRELKEELGVVDAEFSYLCDVSPAVGYSDEKITVFLARKPVFGEQHLDEDEFLNVAVVPLDEALRMADEGEITDSKTLIALYKYVRVSAQA